jgi:hypothetical protein
LISCSYFCSLYLFALLLKQCLIEEYKDKSLAAKQREAISIEKYLEHRKKQEEWIENRIIDLLGNSEFEVPSGAKSPIWVRFLPFGLGESLQFKLVRRRAKIQAKLDLALQYMSIEEIAVLKAEEKQLASFGTGILGMLKRFIYRRYLHPLRDLNGTLHRTNFLPYYAVYAVHTFCILLAGFCTYYIFLFSVMLNRCASCGPPDSMDDDDVANCSTCPDSMRNNNNPNQDIALDWLLTILYTLAFNVFIMEPVKAGVKAAVYPVLVNWALNVNWEKYLLSADDDEILQEIDDWDEDEDGQCGTFIAPPPSLPYALHRHNKHTHIYM